MKIITDKHAYIQKKDIVSLIQFNLEMPKSILSKIFSDDYFVLNDNNRYDFVVFESFNEVNFFKKVDYIIDYNEVKDLSKKEIISLGQSIAYKKNNIAKKFNSMSNEQKEKNKDLVTQCELLNYKMYSLKDVLLFKEGIIKMELPNNIDVISSKKSIKKLIKFNFKKKKNNL